MLRNQNINNLRKINKDIKYTELFNAIEESTKKVAIIFHVGNLGIFNEIITDYPLFFNVAGSKYQHDVYVTISNTNFSDYITTKIPFCNLIILSENRGMDIGPFLKTLEKLKKASTKYEYYIKIHTKTDKKWRNSLILPIYNNFINITESEKIDELKMYGSSEFILNKHFMYNYEYILNIIERNYPELLYKFKEYLIYYQTDQCNKLPKFVGGTIFMFNDKYLELLLQIKNLEYEYEILDNGYIINDSTNPSKTHAWEYFFGYLMYLNNTKINPLSNNVSVVSSKTRAGIYVRTKNEKNIIEFMNYYYKLGFSHIIIYDDNSEPSVTETINNQIINDKFTILNNKNSFNFNIESNKGSDVYTEYFRNEILPIIKNNMDYCLYIDMDEYLYVGGKSKNIIELINNYLPFDSLKINWLLFGNNNILVNNNNSLVTTFTKSGNKLNKLCKSFVNVTSIINNTNPHYFILKDKSIIKNIVNNITKNNPFEEDFTKFKINFEYPYLGHYIIQDTTSFMNRRYLNKNSNRTKNYSVDFKNYLFNNSDTITKELHNNNDLVNNDLINQNYINELLSIKDFFNVHNENIIDNYTILNFLNDTSSPTSFS